MALRKTSDLEVKSYQTDLASPANFVSETKPRGRRGSKMFSLTLGLLVLVGAGSAYYTYQRYQGLNEAIPSFESEQQVNGLLAQLSQIMLLPSNETPTVATVADKTKVSGQLFFKNAENGDALVAYTGSMLAILYRPSVHKIISVAPIVVNAAE